MSAEAWAVSIVETENGGLRLRFTRPLWEFELTPDKARELGAALLLAAEGREPATVVKADETGT